MFLAKNRGPLFRNMRKRRKGARDVIIDWHTHVHMTAEKATPSTIENVLRLHDEVGLDLSVI